MALLRLAVFTENLPLILDHGPVSEDWTENFRQVITDRLGIATGGEPYHDIRFALMAVVPDRRKDCYKRLEMLNTNKMIVVDALRQLVEQHDGGAKNGDSSDDSKEAIQMLEQDVQRVLKEKNAVLKKQKKISSRTSSLDSSCPPGSPFQNNPQLMSHDYAKSPLMEEQVDDDVETEDEDVIDVEDEPPDEAFSTFDPRTKELFEPHKFAPKDLLTLLKTIESDIYACDDSLRDENEKRKKHRVDDCRRVHDYDDFITTFLAMLSERGYLGDLLEHSMNLTSSATARKKVPNNATSNGTANGTASANASKSRSKVHSKSRNQKCRGRPKKKK